MIDEIVLSGFVIACLLAVSPTSLSPFFAKPTTDGVVLAPSALAITVGSPPSNTATQELVVPKSIPITLLISFLLFYLQFTFLTQLLICNLDHRCPDYSAVKSITFLENGAYLAAFVFVGILHHNGVVEIRVKVKSQSFDFFNIGVL